MIDLILKKMPISSLVTHLNINSVRQKVISQNIANINTVDYKSKEVVFDNVLRNSMSQQDMKMTHEQHLNSPDKSAIRIVEDPSQDNLNGINNVNIDHEMVELAKNQMEFNFNATMLARLFNSLRSCIRGNSGDV